MPSSSRHTRTVSPPLTTASYSNATTIGQQKLNVVTRLAIEGKSKKDWDGASIKVYLKVSRRLVCTRRRMLYAFPAEQTQSMDGRGLLCHSLLCSRYERFLSHIRDCWNIVLGPHAASPAFSPLLGYVV